MPEEYAMSSASCGLEKIDITRSFKRPINIAVYGHPYYEVCVRKVLKIIKRPTQGISCPKSQQLYHLK